MRCARLNFLRRRRGSSTRIARSGSGRRRRVGIRRQHLIQDGIVGLHSAQDFDGGGLVHLHADALGFLDDFGQLFYEFPAERGLVEFGEALNLFQSEMPGIDGHDGIGDFGGRSGHGKALIERFHELGKLVLLQAAPDFALHLVRQYGGIFSPILEISVRSSKWRMAASLAGSSFSAGAAACADAADWPAAAGIPG